MKKILIIAAIIVSLVGCNNHQVQNKPDETGTTDIYTQREGESVIDYMCRIEESVKLTPEEIAHWDSMNAEGGYMLVRGAERNLDTIVNHLHLIFTTEP